MTTTTDLIRAADRAQAEFDRARRNDRRTCKPANVRAANAYLRLANHLGVTIDEARRIVRTHREARLMMGTRP